MFKAFSFKPEKFNCTNFEKLTKLPQKFGPDYIYFCIALIDCTYNFTIDDRTNSIYILTSTKWKKN